MEYIGVDHHKEFSYVALMDAQGVILKEGFQNILVGFLRGGFN